MSYYVCFVCIVLNLSPADARNVLLIVADDLGLETNNTVCKAPHLEQLSKRSIVYENAFTSVSSCSPSRASLLTGMPAHQNGMYGLHHDVHHYNCFESVKSISKILGKRNIRTGIIGKKHVGPEKAFPFDFAFTEENNSVLQVGRNITRINHLVHTFLADNDTRPFFLYVAFHDPHRCDHSHPQYGAFCEKFGNGEPGMGLIPDWKPVLYSPSEVIVPYYVPDTPTTRSDIAAQYTTISRLDQGIGMILNQLEDLGLADETLVLFTSDNGSPFPSGRTNLYDPGLREPFLLSNPFEPETWGKKETAQASLLDILPTILDWFSIKYPKSRVLKRNVTLTGRSLLSTKKSSADRPIYSSHILHETTMYYPMRSIRTERFKLIHNINFWAPFPIDQDFYLSPTFQDLLNRTRTSQPTFWSKNLTSYYNRPEWELFDLSVDPQEANNVFEEESFNATKSYLQNLLKSWQKETSDPWLCSPHAVLKDFGPFRKNPVCLPLYN